MPDGRKAFKDLLAQQNLKNTQSRQSIINTIFSEDKHFSAEDLMADLKKNNLSVSKATVYRTLNVLVGGGLVTEHNFGTGEKIYEVANEKPHHDHFYCDRCKKIVEFYEPLEEELIKRAAAKHGFNVSSHVLKIYGLCADCNEII